MGVGVGGAAKGHKGGDDDGVDLHRGGFLLLLKGEV